MNCRVVIRPVSKQVLRAYADVIIDESFAVTGFKIVELDTGLSVLTPQVEKHGIYKDVWLCLNAEASSEFYDSILKAYQEQKEKR